MLIIILIINIALKDDKIYLNISVLIWILLSLQEQKIK